MISSGRIIKVNRRYWGPEAPQAGGEEVYRGSAVLGFQGAKALEQDGFEVLTPAEIGSPEQS